jgi:hypothetical protein
MKTAEKQTCRCGAPLDLNNVEYYDHEGGYDLLGFGQPQWLYHHCDVCGFDYSLWKLGIQYGERPDILALSTLVDEDNPAGAIKAVCKGD